MNYHGGDIYRYNEEVLDFSSNINPLGIPESFRDAFSKDMSCLTRYPDREYRKLKEAILDYLQPLGHEKGIVLGNGAVELIYKILEVLPVERVLIAAPTFSEYRRGAMKAGKPVDEAVLFDQSGRLLMEELIRRITGNTLVILCNPNNPTGTLTSRHDILKILEVLAASKGYLLVDETFIEFTPSYPHSSLINENMENLIIIRALTKYFGMPGIRLGYGILQNKRLEGMIEESMEPWHINAFADLAGQTVLKDTEYIESTKSWIREERVFMFSGLDGLWNFTFLPTESNFLLLRSKKHKAEKIQEILLTKGILIRLPIGFTGLDEFDFRVAIKDRASNNRLLQALDEIDKNI